MSEELSELSETTSDVIEATEALIDAIEEPKPDKPSKGKDKAKKGKGKPTKAPALEPTTAIKARAKGWKRKLIDSIPCRVGGYNVKGWDGVSAWATTDKGSVSINELKRLMLTK